MPLTDTEVKTNLRDMVNAFIKDEADRAGELFHAALQAKMQAKINPVVAEPADTTPEVTDASPEQSAEG